MSDLLPKQHTLLQPAEAGGVGLHTGAKVTVRLMPAEADDGLTFVRTDLKDRPEIKVSPDTVDHTVLRRRTGLINADGVTLATTEHLLASCLAMGIDNARIEVSGPELPIFDGSALPFVRLIEQAGRLEQEAPRRCWQLPRPVSLIREYAEIIAIPAERMELGFFALLERAGLANQACDFSVDDDHGHEYSQRIAPSRTFVFYEDVERLQAAGLIRGGSLDCAIVLRDGRPMNSGYRIENELAAHKLLDLLGDLAVLGRPVHALITARGAGHALNHEFIQLLRKELTE